MPGLCILGALKVGASPFRVSAKQYAKRIVGAGCRIDEAIVPLLRAGAPLTTYTIDTQRAVVDGSGILRSRARIDLPWRLEFSIVFDDELFDSPARGHELLRTVLDYAGKFCGLLDFRPSAPKSPGSYGRFTVAAFDPAA